MKERKYIAIDLKSFYASVECVERGLDPLTTNLVVADESRTVKTICLAVSPSLKSFGISGRARLFEAVARVDEVNAERLSRSPNGKFTGSSSNINEINSDPSLAVGFITAPPQMSHYIKKSTEIYKIYLRYIAPEDIHVYSVDEVFIDVTNYLQTYKMTAHELALTLVREVLSETGITATAGIGSNLYLCKVAMDIVAKKMPPDSDGVRIAELDEMSYREKLWDHRPITDFWRVGAGTARNLAARGIFSMGDVARCSVCNEDLLYKLFGVNAELLIDHAWGWEPCTVKDIKSYRPESHSVSIGQVLSTPYSFEKARLIVREMTELLALDIVSKELVTDQIVLTVGYDPLSDSRGFKGEVKTDYYGRLVPKHAHGSENLGGFTSSSRKIVAAAMRLFDRITDENLLVRRIYVVANNTVFEDESNVGCEQLDLFTDFEAAEALHAADMRERSLQHAVISLQTRYGKNTVLKGMNFLQGATTIQRNGQIGGHRA